MTYLSSPFLFEAAISKLTVLSSHSGSECTCKFDSEVYVLSVADVFGTYMPGNAVLSIGRYLSAARTASSSLVHWMKLSKVVPPFYAKTGKYPSVRTSPF